VSLPAGPLLDAGAATDTGRVRAGNEDAYLVAAPVFAVADGMGGHRGGEVASRIAVEELRGRVAALAAAADGEALDEAVREAGRAILRAADADAAMRGMATTCTVALVRGGTARVAHVGDSRAYRWRDGRVVQLTEDHSVVALLVREGSLSAEEAAVHPARNVVFRALGLDPDVEVDAVEALLLAGDRLLLCSDGLTNMIDDDEIERVLGSVEGAQAAAEVLVGMANAAGGTDNITVVVVDVPGEPGGATP
jgi:PPM family protein phosphatase